MMASAFAWKQLQHLKVLILGQFAEDAAFCEEVKRTVYESYCVTDPAQAYEIVHNNNIGLIFGTATHQENSYVEALSKIRLEKHDIDVILFLAPSDASKLQDILALQAKRYYCQSLEGRNALRHFKSSLYELTYHNYFTNDTQYFEALLNASIVSQSDVNGAITYINENFTKVTGYTLDEVVGKNHNIIRHEANPIEVYQSMWETIKRGEVWRERLLNKNKDGSDFWADTIIIPFKDYQTGEIIQYIAVRRDITQMLIEKRTMQEKEIRAQEQLKLSEAKDSFLVLFTHELKTPLNAIINFSEYLLKNLDRIDEISRSRKEHLLDQIHKSATSMLENVSNILDLSRLRHNKINYAKSFFNVKDMLNDVLEKHQSLANEHKRSVVFQDDGSNPFIYSDAYRFKQIVANVLSNAIKYGRSEVEIFLLSDANKVEIIIQDDGKGIPDKSVVFELYEQSSKGLTNMEKKGTGIGLNFVKLLCEGLNIEYAIEDSVSLGGTKFILRKVLKEDMNG